MKTYPCEWKNDTQTTKHQAVELDHPSERRQTRTMELDNETVIIGTGAVTRSRPCHIIAMVTVLLLMTLITIIICDVTWVCTNILGRLKVDKMHLYCFQWLLISWLLSNKKVDICTMNKIKVGKVLWAKSSSYVPVAVSISLSVVICHFVIKLQFHFLRFEN